MTSPFFCYQLTLTCIFYKICKCGGISYETVRLYTIYVIFAFQKAFNLFLPRSRSTQRLDSLWLTWRQQAYYITCMLHKSSALEIAPRIAVTVTYSRRKTSEKLSISKVESFTLKCWVLFAVKNGYNLTVQGLLSSIGCKLLHLLRNPFFFQCNVSLFFKGNVKTSTFISVLKKSRVILPCEFRTEGIIWYTVSWEKDRGEGFETVAEYTRGESQPRFEPSKKVTSYISEGREKINFDLVITKVKDDDSATYRCRVFTSSGEKMGITNLQVSGKITVMRLRILVKISTYNRTYM